MVEQACRRGRWRGGSISNTKQDIWKTYRQVSHFWAALHVWNDRAYGAEVLGTPGGMCFFLMMAEWFRREGEAFVPLRGGAPVLDTEETWKIRPEVSAEWKIIEIGCSNLDAWDLRKRIKIRD
jgi:hypothetical protein